MGRGRTFDVAAGGLGPLTLRVATPATAPEEGERALDRKAERPWGLSSRHPDLNWGPTDYESVALPAELCRRSRVSLASLAYRRKGSAERARRDVASPPRHP